MNNPLAHTEFFASCPKGLEGVLKQELTDLGAESSKETVAGVYFTGPLALAYKACLWSRLANRVLLPLGRFDAESAEQLYEAALSIDWSDHLEAEGHFVIDFSGTNRSIRHSQFGAQTIKDAIVDQFRQNTGKRPNVDKTSPDLRINARLSRGKVVIAVDLSGDSLHRRGYRTRQGAAPLKENLAAAVLIRSNWPALAEQGGSLIDPMCGSGTLLIEAAMMATDRAPGLKRDFAFETWRQHSDAIWTPLLEDAKQRFESGKAKLPVIIGYDQDGKVLAAARSNIAIAGFEESIKVYQKPLEDFVLPSHQPIESGLLICNPPYGERLGEVEELKTLYRSLGSKMREHLTGWQGGIFTGNPDLGKQMGIRSRKRYKLFNGSLPSELLMFDIVPEFFVKDSNLQESTERTESRVQTLTDGAQSLVNRLKKNQKQLAKWVKREGIECYRLYDADMPEYSAAIDVYGDYVHVQEYQAPKTIDPDKAQYRFDEICLAVPTALQIPAERMSVKQRRRNRGSQQYDRVSEEQRETILVNEGPARLHINLWEYLDTGLFLDHRPVRSRIAQMARGKRFLNLFCYTATATVHAALGGATDSVSVDMSKTYLRWAKKNLDENSMNSDRHQLVQGDCIEWLQQCREGFDLIMLDPPSFSNSKRMEGVFDVQRDHNKTVRRCMDLLSPGGTLVFSNNLRTFKLDKDLEEDFSVDNISQQTLDPDFKRNPKIHQCWLIQHSK